jgi:hypothetical protein
MNSQVLNLSTGEGERREVMSDPDLFWTLWAMIAANIILLVSAFIAVDREARKFRTDDGET